MQQNEFERHIGMAKPMVAEIFNMLYADKKTGEETQKLRKGIADLNNALEKFLGWEKDPGRGA